MPTLMSPGAFKTSASTPGSSVVTSMSKGAKSSATRRQICWMAVRSSAEKVSGSPSMSKAATWMGSSKSSFQPVPVMT